MCGATSAPAGEQRCASHLQAELWGWGDATLRSHEGPSPLRDAASLRGPYREIHFLVPLLPVEAPGSQRKPQGQGAG